MQTVIFAETLFWKHDRVVRKIHKTKTMGIFDSSNIPKKSRIPQNLDILEKEIKV